MLRNKLMELVYPFAGNGNGVINNPLGGTLRARAEAPSQDGFVSVVVNRFEDMECCVSCGPLGGVFPLHHVDEGPDKI